MPAARAVVETTATVRFVLMEVLVELLPVRFAFRVFVFGEGNLGTFQIQLRGCQFMC
jgi:hypothetical protein